MRASHDKPAGLLQQLLKHLPVLHLHTKLTAIARQNRKTVQHRLAKDKMVVDGHPKGLPPRKAMNIPEIPDDIAEGFVVEEVAPSAY